MTTSTALLMHQSKVDMPSKKRKWQRGLRRVH